MSIAPHRSDESRRPWLRPQGPRTVGAGASLLALAAAASAALAEGRFGTPTRIGPDFVPALLAGLVGAIGLGLIAAGWVRPDRDEGGTGPARARGPVLVTTAILAFAVAIKSAGLLVAGPLAIVLGGLASPEARLRELIPFAIGITLLSALLFRVALGLPLPILHVPGFVRL